MKDISVFQQSANYTYIQKYKALQINARCRGIGKTVAVNVGDRLSIGRAGVATPETRSPGR